MHGIDQGGPHFGIAEIQVNDIIPSVALGEVTPRVPGIIFRMFPGPVVVPSGMIGHPVNDDPETQLVGLADEAPEILHTSKFWIDGAVIGTCIIAAE